MPEFNLDNFKKTWQEQRVLPKYGNSDIEAMLHKSSRNYVKYIFWISVTEFSVILCMNLYYSFFGDDSKSFMNILGRLGVKSSINLEASFSHLYFVLKIISLLLTALFVVKFYRNYRNIKVESNLKKFILQIINFKKTVHIFILANIALLILFAIVLTIFVFYVFSLQDIHLDNSTLSGFVVGVILMTLLCISLIWLYYRIVYGIIMKYLGKNLDELQKIDAQE